MDESKSILTSIFLVLRGGLEARSVRTDNIFSTSLESASSSGNSVRSLRAESDSREEVRLSGRDVEELALVTDVDIRCVFCGVFTCLRRGVLLGVRGGTVLTVGLRAIEWSPRAERTVMGKVC